MELINLLIGVFVLALGIPIGNLLAKFTKEELNSGQIWFKFIAILSSVGGFIGLIISNDVLMFSFFFIAIVTSRSLKNKSKNKN
jgi:hypothetical protein